VHPVPRKYVLMIASVLLIAGTTACSSTKVNQGFDPAVDFATFKTFAFSDRSLIENDAVRGGIEAMVNDQLVAAGLRPVERSPDLLVAVHGALDEHTRFDVYDWGYAPVNGWSAWYGYGWGGYYGATLSLRNISVGTILVDLVDADRQLLVWRGTAEAKMSESKRGATHVRNIESMVKKIFAGFPPPFVPPEAAQTP